MITGDFNAAAEKNKAYSLLTEDKFFTDAWLVAKERKGEGIATFNGFEGIKSSGVRIDWILTHGEVAVDRMETVTFSRDGRFPSDHFPIVAQLRLGAAKK